MATATGFSLAGVIRQPTVMMAVALMGIITMMILPVPAIVLDIGLAASFALAILIFTNTLFIARPLDFSSFPTVLLASLMLRLALNVSSTKLIIGEGHKGTHAAGGVIEGFAMFVMSGSIFLGLVVFCVLLIVNFMVITKGAGRMAEVGARFALDGMPGKQMAIDSDMAAGAITHVEARERRKIEQEETTFFGSLDGVSKFVKGDAVAGLLITLLNLCVGLGVGILVHDMAFGQAIETYAILTVGDGLVNQIPAVVISIASALLLSKGGAVGSADQAMLSQLGGHPRALATVAGLLALFAFVPGLPFIPFVLGAGVLGLAAYFADREAKARASARLKEAEAEPAPTAQSLGDILDLDELHVEFAADLVPLVMDPVSGLDNRIVSMRNHIARSFGIVLPEIRLSDDLALSAETYIIRIQGVEVARGSVRSGKVLMLCHQDATDLPPGEEVAEPVYGAPARWIDTSAQEQAALHGLAVVSPAEVVATHLLEIIKTHLSRLFSRRALRRLIDETRNPTDPDRAQTNKTLIDEFIPDPISIERLHAVLKLLLAEQVSVRNLHLILEAMAEIAATTGDPVRLAEHVRCRLGFQITANLVNDQGKLPLLQLAPSWEKTFSKYDTGTDCPLPPREINRLAKAIAEGVEKAGETGQRPVLAVLASRRRMLQTILSAKGQHLPVLSFDEIGHNHHALLLGQV
ncbi:MAG: flagellar biosynthesis protein FlhA [Pseudomonadota bacterium]